MESNENKYMTVAYELYVDRDGKETMVEKAPEEQPFQFVSGMGVTLELFEANVASLAKGDTFDFVIPMADAYGEIDPAHIIDLPKEIFEIDGKFDSERVFAGNIIPMLNSDGNHLNGTVVEVKSDSVRMDFNHPYAGKDLHFGPDDEHIFFSLKYFTTIVINTNSSIDWERVFMRFNNDCHIVVNNL